MVLVQKWPFFLVLFFKKYRPGKCVLRYSRTKKRHSIARKRGRSISRKIDIFPNVLTHGFGPKMAIFSTFHFRNTALENVFYDILERKNAFQGYKNPKFK